MGSHGSLSLTEQQLLWLLCRRMTTSHSCSWLGLGALSWSCSLPPPAPGIHVPNPETTTAASVATSSAPPEPAPPNPYGEWTEIARGVGNGHALPGVEELSVSVTASDERARGYYCNGPLADALAPFGIAQTMNLNERSLHYVIELGADGRWRYSIHEDGETISGGPLCAACHEQGRPDPLFRAFRATACR